MSDDLVKRLRMVTGFIRFETGDRIAASACLSEEAADRIEELEAKLAKAVEALAKISDRPGERVSYDDYETRKAMRDMENIADATLAELTARQGGE